MPGRVLACAIAMGMALPAFAGEDGRPAATNGHARYSPDTLPLLLQDQEVTWGAPAPLAQLAQLAPGFDMAAAITVTAARPMPDDLTSFESLGAPAAASYLPATPVRTEMVAFSTPNGFVATPGIRLTARQRAEPMGGATDALREASALPRPYRPRRSPLDTMLVFRLDGEPASPALSFGGGVASILNVLQRQ
jgi:hypothetical protein